MSLTSKSRLYSIVIAIHSSPDTSTTLSSKAPGQNDDSELDWRLGDISVDWVDFTREKSFDNSDASSPSSMGSVAKGVTGKPQATQATKKRGPQRHVPGSDTRGSSSDTSTSTNTSRNASGQSSTPKSNQSNDSDTLSLQPLLGHFPGPSPLESSVAKGVSSVGRGVVHLFRHAPPAHLIASLEAHPVGEGSGSNRSSFDGKAMVADEWGGEKAEGEDGSLLAILAVPAWMRPADFLEFIGGWGTCLEGVRMIR